MNVEENYDSDNMEGYPKAFTDDYSKKKAAPKQVFTRSAYKNFISTFTVQNDEKVKGFKGLKILKEVKRKLKSTLQEHGQIKYYAVARLLMKKKLDDKVLERTDDFYVAGQKHELQREDQISEAVGLDIDYFKDAIPERQARTGSNWIFTRVVSMEVHTVRNKPLPPDVPRLWANGCDHGGSTSTIYLEYGNIRLASPPRPAPDLRSVLRWALQLVGGG
jgi:hypothetical protein